MDPRTKAIRDQRREALRPIFDKMDREGRIRAWLAREVGVTRATLWHYEHGTNRVPQWFLERACAALGMSPNDIHLPNGPGGMHVQKLGEHRQRPLKLRDGTQRQQRERTNGISPSHHGYQRPTQHGTARGNERRRAASA
jgi:DNA-binding XRE family transcriptional regulator